MLKKRKQNLLEALQLSTQPFNCRWNFISSEDHYLRSYPSATSSVTSATLAMSYLKKIRGEKCKWKKMSRRMNYFFKKFYFFLSTVEYYGKEGEIKRRKIKHLFLLWSGRWYSLPAYDNHKYLRDRLFGCRLNRSQKKSLFTLRLTAEKSGLSIGMLKVVLSE